jgi:hypothetical protein
MTKYFFIIFASLAILTIQSCKQSSSIFKQNDKDNSSKFYSQGEYEQYYITNSFKGKYQTHSYPKYPGQIIVENQSNLICIRYDSVPVCINQGDSSYLSMFTSGLVYGQLLPILSTARSIEIEELTYLKTKPTQHRFKFTVFQPNFMNPSVFLLELTNTKADKNTDFMSFMKDAEVTYISKTWLQI